jgi:hypothetical protein
VFQTDLACAACPQAAGGLQVRRQHPWTAIGSSSSGSESESEERGVVETCMDDGAGMWAVPLHLDDGEGERPANPAPTPSSDGAPLAARHTAASLHQPVVLHAHMYPQHHHASTDSSPEYGEPGDTGVYLHGAEDDAVVRGAWAAATGTGGTAAQGKRVRGSVKPHSGLEAQEAADYEARLIAGEEREARTAADRSGQSSDDEDGGGSGELAAAIDQQRKRSAAAASASKKAHWGGGSGDAVAPRGPTPTAALPSGASEYPGAPHSDSDSEDADKVEALRLAAALASQQESDNRESSDEDERVSVHAAAAAVALKTPNRFLDVPLEPLEPDSLALAAAILSDRDEGDTDTGGGGSIARSEQPSGSVDEVVGHLLHDLEPTLPLSAAATSGGGGGGGGAVTSRPPLAHSQVVGQEGVAQPPDKDDALGVCSGGPEDEELCSALGLTPSAPGGAGAAGNAARSSERRAAEAGL